MFNSKTYFEQVPLEFVKHVVEEQIQVEATSETIEGLDTELLVEGLSEAEGRSSLEPSATAQAESVN
jgi:hypothetical protein